MSEDGLGFEIMSLSRMGEGGNWKTEAMRSYDRPVLIWFTRGNGWVNINGINHNYRANCFVYLPKTTMNGFQITSQTEGTYVSFPKDCSLEQALPEEPIVLHVDDHHQQNNLRVLINDMSDEVGKQTDRAERAMTHYGGLIAIWLERQLENATENKQKHQSLAQLAQAFASLVEKDYQSQKSVRDYAADLGITPTHLSRVCNYTCGRPASMILQDRVHYEARRLLSETRMPIKDIAQKLGFRSAAYFTRAFQTYTGQTPSSFRKAS